MEDLPSPLSNHPRSDQSPLSDPEVQKVHAQLMREKEEPQEGFPPLPIALLFLFAIVVFISGLYLGKHSAGFSAFVYDPNYDPATAAQASSKPAFDPIARGERVFSQKCAQCHQSNGEGLPGTYPPLAGSSWVTDTRVIPASILLNGLSGPIEVKGNVYDGNVMPAFGDLLSDRDIGAVLTYVRQAWGNQAEPISEEQVAEARSLHGGRGSPWTADELLALAPLETVSAAPEAEATGEATEAQEEDSGEGSADAAAESTENSESSNETGTSESSEPSQDQGTANAI
ncbi:c-type cytochrome [Puniceicoccus vermicola]|uniref:Cytochrome c n=1 Tax=Puniceicoccus vermicola TaxID=388746 RepID=A0A7X1E3C2_9BACT|nr:cytochrome c [Puniceicoccus vermicola]MBC2600828.1 cytochrome c [Puniceicoccus vermicola]